MAVIYLSSVDGNDADGGTTWALAKATLAAALTSAGAGGTVYVDNAHAETQASAMTLTSPGTAASPVQILCVDRTGNPEPPTALAVTATVSTTGSNSSITFAGFAHSYGVAYQASGANFAAGLLFTSTNPWYWVLESNGGLVLRIVGSATATLSVGASSTSADDQSLDINNGAIRFGGSGQTVTLRCPLTWKGGSVDAAGTSPTTLILTAINATRALIRGVDLSAMGSGTSLVDVSVPCSASVRFQNCKLGSSVSVTTGTNPGQGGVQVDLVNCDSADTNYRYKASRYQGEIDHETVIVRSSGASDGTTPISRKMVSSANSKIYSPLVLDGIVIWNETVGSSITATIEAVTDGVTLTDKEAWVEAEYLGTSGFPLALFANDRASANNAHLGSGSNQASSSVTWTTTGLSSPVKQKFGVSFTPQEKGPIRLRVILAKPSTTMYICPKVDIT